MSRSVEAEIEFLTGTHAWVATPDNYSSIRCIVLGPEGAGMVIYAYGQTTYAQIDVRFEVTAPGVLRLDYIETPQPHRRPPFVPTGAKGSKVIGFSLAEGEWTFREDVTGFVFRFSWTLEFSEPPFPDGLSLPYSVPNVFYGYRERIGDRFTPVS